MSPARQDAAQGHRGNGDRAVAIRTIIGDVIAEAVRAAGASGVILLDDETPEGGLAHEWLVEALGPERVWRGAAVASNVQGTGADRRDAQLLGAWQLARERSGLIADPSSRTALLLGGALPRADLFPLGDLYASQIERLAGGSTLAHEIATLARRAGGLEALDAALARLVDARLPADTALHALDDEVAHELLRLYERGRYYRLRPRLVPKLSARTLGVDLFD